MDIEKIAIIGIDGLEIELIEKWNLNGYKQEKYGWFEIKPEYFHEKEKVPYTPIIWATILTGKKPHEHKIKTFYTYGKILDWIRNRKIIRKIKNKRLYLEKIGIKPKMFTLKGQTFLDKIQPSTAIWVPGYNDTYELHKPLAQAIKQGGIKQYEKEIQKQHEKRKQKTLQEINKNWKIFMTYFDILDLYGHIYYIKHPNKLKKWYQNIEKLIQQIKNKLPKNTLVLIISDHGMQNSGDGITGNHSNKAFWSINKNIPWQPKDFTDIHKLITQIFPT